MTPTAPDVLSELASLLVRHAAGAVSEAERPAQLGIVAALLLTAADRWDGMAARLVEENRALRALLGETGDDPDLHISALRAANDALRDRLIQAHAAAEAAGDTAREAAIWAELIASTERRRLPNEPI